MRIPDVSRFALVVLALSTALLTPAHATNFGAPGTLCRTSYQSHQPYLEYSTDGSVTTDTNTTLICPLTGDTPSDSNGLADMEAFVDPADGTTMTCTIRCMSPTGSQLDSDASTTSGNAAQKLDWGAFSASCGTQPSYVLSCDFDDGDKLHALRWTE